jgi:hypothetical protein
MAAMKCSTAWKNGQQKFPATSVTEPNILELLAANGFRKNEIDMETFPANQDDYHEVIFFSSTKSL